LKPRATDLASLALCTGLKIDIPLRGISWSIF
jgi:hypothetical protein